MRGAPLGLLVATTLLFAAMGLLPAAGLASHPPIRIVGNAGFTPANGVTRGTGTPTDPYVIEGWEIGLGASIGIEVRDTDAFFLVRNTAITGTGVGVALSNVSHGRFEGVGVSDASVGVTVSVSRDVSFEGNSIANNVEGILLAESTDVSFRKNVFVKDGIELPGPTLADFDSLTITDDNLVNGIPIRFHAGCSGLTIDGIPAGQVIVANCTDVRIANLEIADSSYGIQAYFIDGLRIEDNRVHDEFYGILAGYSTNITLVRNAVSTDFPVEVGAGIHLFQSSRADVSGNAVTRSGHGIYLQNSVDVKATCNKLYATSEGLREWVNTRASIFHNSFLSNSRQAYSGNSSGSNSWDGGYPAGGNYWSDYVGEDRFSGPGQDRPGSDGIGDTPYAGWVTDRYPLMTPSLCVTANLPPVASFSVTVRGEVTVPRIAVDASDSWDTEDLPADLDVRWDWEGDGTWDTDWVSYKTATHDYPEPGTFTVRLQVRDTGGLLSETSHTADVRVSSPINIPAAGTNWAPLLAAMFAFALAVVGIWSSRKRTRRRGTTSTSPGVAFAVTSAPFIILEVAIGVVSLFTGVLSVPPLVGPGIAADLAILLAGITVAALRA